MSDDLIGPPRRWEFEAGKRNYDVKSDIDRFVANTEQRLLNVVAQSILDTVKDVQTPVAKGGRMRVKTGFLRLSGIGSLNAAPVGLSKPVKGNVYAEWKGDAIEATLSKMKFGDVFYFGWTAHYAKYREAFDGFLESALQNWQTHVDKAVAYYKNKDLLK